MIYLISYFFTFNILFNGDIMFEIGDIVTRKSYDHDVVFKITNIKGNFCYLKGINIRLSADSPTEDLVKCDIKKVKDDFWPELEEYRTLDRNEYFYLPGKILHIDADNEYLEKCLEFYRKNKIKVYGLYLKENELAENIRKYLEMYNPDILVITGHDAFFRKERNRPNYKNTDNFINAIKEARKYEKSHEKLLIIAGACQSNYEELIKAGANFASSPKRINIHALDPAIIAGSLAFSDKRKSINLIRILEKTKYGSDGIGGIITNGTMYVGYPRE